MRSIPILVLIFFQATVNRSFFWIEHGFTFTHDGDFFILALVVLTGSYSGSTNSILPRQLKHMLCPLWGPKATRACGNRLVHTVNLTLRLDCKPSRVITQQSLLIAKWSQSTRLTLVQLLHSQDKRDRSGEEILLYHPYVVQIAQAPSVLGKSSRFWYLIVIAFRRYTQNQPQKTGLMTP